MDPFASTTADSPRSDTTLPRMRTVLLVKASRYFALIRGVASEAIFGLPLGCVSAYSVEWERGLGWTQKVGGWWLMIDGRWLKERYVGIGKKKVESELYVLRTSYLRSSYLRCTLRCTLWLLSINYQYQHQYQYHYQLATANWKLSRLLLYYCILL